MKKLKGTVNDASAPIVKPCYVDVSAIWNAHTPKQSVSRDLEGRVLKALSGESAKVC